MGSPQKSPQWAAPPRFSKLQVIDLNGERGRNRTFNLVIKSHLLCQLSYAPLSATVCRNSAQSTAPDCNYNLSPGLFSRRERRGGGGDLRDVEQARRPRHPSQTVTQHRLAEGAGRGDHRRARGGQFFGARHVDSLPLFLAQEHLPAAGAAAE